MAVLVQEPADSLPGTGDWQQQLRRTSLSLRGFFALDVTEKSTDRIPRIIAGSMFEMDGSLWRVPETDSQGIRWNTGIGFNTFVFCYAQQIDTQSVEFVWHAEEPEYDPVRKGWYSGTVPGRCVLSAYRRSPVHILCKALRGADFLSAPTHTPPPIDFPPDIISTLQQVVFILTVAGDIVIQSARVQPGWYYTRLHPGDSLCRTSDNGIMRFSTAPFGSTLHNIWIDRPGNLSLIGGRNALESSIVWRTQRGSSARLHLDDALLLKAVAVGEMQSSFANQVLRSDVFIR